MLTHSCPIDQHKIDEHVARVNALFTIIFLTLGLIYHPLFWFFLLLDFTVRSLKLTKLSPFARTSKLVLNSLHIHPKPIDRAPKLFAARIGLIMSVLLLTFFYLAMPMFWKTALAFFFLAAALESFFAYCLGCQIYSLLLSLKIIKR